MAVDPPPLENSPAGDAIVIWPRVFMVSVFPKG